MRPQPPLLLRSWRVSAAAAEATQFTAFLRAAAESGGDGAAVLLLEEAAEGAK